MRSLTPSYLFFFSRFACLFSLAVFWGAFFVSFLVSLDFGIQFCLLQSYMTTMSDTDED